MVANRFIGPVLGGIPATESEIQSTDERHAIVGDDDFLVMRCTDGMMVVQAIVHAPVR